MGQALSTAPPHPSRRSVVPNLTLLSCTPQLVVGSDPRPGSPVDVLIAVVTVSRNHARLTLEGDKVIVTDLGSLNGTYVEGKRITKGERVPLAIGQTVSFEAERGVSYTLTEASFVQKAMASLSGGAAPAWSSEAEMGALGEAARADRRAAASREYSATSRIRAAEAICADRTAFVAWPLYRYCLRAESLH